MRKVKIIVMLLFLISCGCDPRYGFIESQFSLSPESRLPKWFEKPAEYSRNEYDVRLTFYTSGKVKIKIVSPSEKKTVSLKTGESRWHPDTEKQFEYGKDYEYPTYTIIRVGKISEVFEHREEGPILYITDDPKWTAILNENPKEIPSPK